MKKKLILTGLIAGFMTVAITLVSCSNLIEDLKEKRKIQLPQYQMVDVISSSITVTGTDPSFIDSDANNSYKGVFRTGRNVTISPYSMGKYEVSQELYKMIMEGEKVNGATLEAEPSYCREIDHYPLVEGEVQNMRPVEGVTWYDAVYFCNVFTEKVLGEDKKVYTISDITVSTEGHIISATVEMDRTKTGYRLPTEAEWEFAARGGDPSKPDWNYLFSGHDKADESYYYNQNNLGMDSVGWYYSNTENGGVTCGSILKHGIAGYGTHEIGKKGYNLLGIYDMSGNAWERCFDRYEDSVGTGNVTDPTGASSGSYRIIRGGSWITYAYDCTVCFRGYNLSDSCYNSVGFRLVRSKSE